MYITSLLEVYSREASLSVTVENYWWAVSQTTRNSGPLIFYDTRVCAHSCFYSITEKPKAIRARYICRGLCHSLRIYLHHNRSFRLINIKIRKRRNYDEKFKWFKVSKRLYSGYVRSRFYCLEYFISSVVHVVLGFCSSLYGLFIHFYHNFFPSRPRKLLLKENRRKRPCTKHPVVYIFFSTQDNVR